MQSSETYPVPLEPSPKITPINRKIGLDKPTCSQERTKIDMPLDIVISLLRPDELAKLKKYVASYLGKH